MKLLLASLLLVSLTMAIPSEHPQQSKDYGYENVEKLSAEDIDCLLSDANCSKNMAKIKVVILNAFMDYCKTCGEVDKKHAGQVMAQLLFKHPKHWNKFVARYDWQGKHKDLYTNQY